MCICIIISVYIYIYTYNYTYTHNDYDYTSRPGDSAEGGCSRRGVQWMGVVLYNKLVIPYKSLRPVSTAPPFDES